MQYVCDAPGRKTWFRIETEGEAAIETEAMRHGVDNHFRHLAKEAAASYRPDDRLRPIERNIGLKAHVERTMPVFLTLRDREGTALATAMLPPKGTSRAAFDPLIMGPDYSDPKSEHADAIGALEKHFGVDLRSAGHNPFANFCF